MPPTPSTRSKRHLEFRTVPTRDSACSRNGSAPSAMMLAIVDDSGSNRFRQATEGRSSLRDVRSSLREKRFERRQDDLMPRISNDAARSFLVETPMLCETRVAASDQ